MTRIIAITGPTGVGKSTLLEKLVENYNLCDPKDCCVDTEQTRSRKLQRLVTYTTRPIRADEIDGVHYRFVTESKFFELLRSGELLEVDCYNDNFYGIPATLPEDSVSLIAVNFNGIKNLKRCWGKQAKTVCLIADIETIKQRLLKRAGLTVESAAHTTAPDLGRRIKSAEEELRVLTSRGKEFIDFYLENCSIPETLSRLKTLICLWTTQF